MNLTYLQHLTKLDAFAIFVINVALAGLVHRVYHIIRVNRDKPVRVGW